MKNFFLIMLLSLNFCDLNAQDRIIKKNGEITNVKILSIDSTQINLITQISGKIFTTYINLTDVASYTYRGRIYKQNNDRKFDVVEFKSPHKKEYLDADSIEKKYKYFLYTYSGEIVNAPEVEYRTGFLQQPCIVADGRKYKPETIKFFKNEEGVYANSKEAERNTNSNFVIRVKNGKVNLYEIKTTNYHPGSYNSSTAMFSPGINTTSIKNYYNFGFNDLKKTTYKNLSEDIGDNPLCQPYLIKYKNISKTQAYLTGFGVGITIIGFATLVSKTKDWDGSDNTPEPKTTGNIITLAVGSGMVGIAYFLTFSKPKQLRKAVDAYNQ